MAEKKDQKEECFLLLRLGSCYVTETVLQAKLLPQASMCGITDECHIAHLPNTLNMNSCSN